MFEDDLRPFRSVERSLAALIVHPRDAVLGALVGALHLKGRLSKAGLGDFSEPLPFSPVQDPRETVFVAGITGFGEQDADLDDTFRFGEALLRGAVKDIRERSVMSSSDKASLEITDGGVTRKPAEMTRKRTRIRVGSRSPALGGLGPFQRAAPVRVSVCGGGWRAKVGTAGSAGQSPRSSSSVRVQIFRRQTRTRDQELVIAVAVDVVVNESRGRRVQAAKDEIDLSANPTITIPAVSPNGIVLRKDLGLPRKILCRECVRGANLQVQSELSEQLLTRERAVASSRVHRKFEVRVFAQGSKVREIGVSRGLVTIVRHGQGADNVIEFIMIPELAVSVTGNEGMVHLRGGLGKTSHAIEGFGVEHSTQRRLRQVRTDDQDHADNHGNSEATTLLPTNGARDSRAKHNRRREIRIVMKDRMALSSRVRGLTHTRISPCGGARVLAARVERSADRVMGRISEGERGEVRTLKGLLETDAVPVAVLGDVRKERSVVKLRDSVNVPGKEDEVSFRNGAGGAACTCRASRAPLAG